MGCYFALFRTFMVYVVAAGFRCRAGAVTIFPLIIRRTPLTRTGNRHTHVIPCQSIHSILFLRYSLGTQAEFLVKGNVLSSYRFLIGNLHHAFALCLDVK